MDVILVRLVSMACRDDDSQYYQKHFTLPLAPFPGLCVTLGWNFWPSPITTVVTNGQYVFCELPEVTVPNFEAKRMFTHGWKPAGKEPYEVVA